MTKKEYISPEMMVLEMDHTVELMQSSNNVDPGDQSGTIGGSVGFAPFEQPYNG